LFKEGKKCRKFRKAGKQERRKAGKKEVRKQRKERNTFIFIHEPSSIFSSRYRWSRTLGLNAVWETYTPIKECGYS